MREAGEREISGRAIELRLEQHGVPRAYPAAFEDQLLKIGREAIVNAARHSRADQISIELEVDEAEVTLRVTDNGTGFDQRTTCSGDGDSHCGLTSMRDR